MNTTGFWVLNKTAVKNLGLANAMFLSVLVEAEELLADDEGWFCQTIESTKDKVGLSRHKQDRVIKELEELGILEKKVDGLPAKRYFKINNESLAEALQPTTKQE